MSKYWIQTFTGIEFDLLNPTEDMICVKDIAHHNSIENRYNGGSKFPFSVNYHSYLGAMQADEEFRLEFLFHDSHESYYKDWTSPFKHMLAEMAGIEYKDIIREYEICVQSKFKLDFYKYKDKIKTIDLRMAKTEKQLLFDNPKCWHPSVENAEPFTNVNIMEISFNNVERLFLETFEKYKRT